MMKLVIESAETGAVLNMRMEDSGNSGKNITWLAQRGFYWNQCRRACGTCWVAENRRLKIAYWCLTIIVILAELYEQTSKRLPNKKRNRQHAIDKLGEFSDFEFKLQTGLSRNMFNYVLGLMRPKLIKNNTSRSTSRRMAELSSGSPIPTALKLFNHLRIMKGSNIQI